MAKRKLNAQAALEFILLSSILFFIFIVMFGIVSYNMSYANKKKTNMIGEDVVIKVQKEVNLAARVLDGYSREFYLPLKLGSKDYTISIQGNEVVASVDNDDYWRKIPNVTGIIRIGYNTIRKENGIIYLN
jgi:hypothetical protein